LDPDEPDQRRRLQAAAADPDARMRRIAVAILAESRDPDVAGRAVRTAYADESRVVRRTAIDAAADTESEGLRDLFEEATGSADEWIRWKAIRALRSIGVGPSLHLLTTLSDDPDFQVRLEVAAALREVQP
jgi:HEAT repeat protein